MNDIDQIQKRRSSILRAWLEENGGAAEVIRRRSLSESSASYLSQLIGGYSFGERAARNWEKKLGLPHRYLDGGTPPSVEGPDVRGQVAQELILTSFKVPAQLDWESLMQSVELPERFSTKVPDDALAPNLPRGTAVVFEKAKTARPRQCVLVQDKDGGRYIRRYAQGQGATWQAQALDSAYLTLHSDRDGLEILAVMTWRESSEI